MSTPPRNRPRTLADALRGWDDAALERLVRRRPDLARPVPADTGQLAARATSHASAARAVNRLDEFGVDLLEALSALLEPVDLPTLCKGVDQPLEVVRPRITELQELALVWGTDEDLRTIRAVHELLGPTPAGLGPVTTRHFGDLDRLIAEAGPDARQVLERLTWGPPTGTVEKADRGVTIASAKSPIEHLLARGLLAVKDGQTVVLPRQIGLHLRGGRVQASTRPAPPPLTGRQVSTRTADQAAAGAALDLVGQVERILEQLGTEPPPVLRTGGIGVRELRALATKVGIDEQVAATVLEVAYAAGMVTELEVGHTELWLPTPAYDDWLDLDTAHRWERLVTAWLTGMRTIGLVGRRDDRERLVNALAPDLERLLAPEIRELTLDALTATELGLAPSTDGLITWVAWHRPRRGGQFRDDLVRWTLDEAAALGLTALGTLSTQTRQALHTGGWADAIGGLVPAPVDHILLQADLTAIAPGPLAREAYAELAAMADAESHGTAAVYRFSEASIRRAFDLGRTGDQLHSWLNEHSRTPVPQPLTYLIDDVARRHGVLRIGAASTYLRCDDETVIAGLITNTPPGLRFRRLAPTVLMSPSPPDIVLERLRGAGLTPLGESFDGVVHVIAPNNRRGRPATRRTGHDPADPIDPAAELTAERAAKVVASIRRGDRVAAERPADVLTTPAETISLLADAAEANIRTWISYVDHNGLTTERIVAPVRVSEGWLTAYDAGEDNGVEPRTYALHRISAARPIEEGSSQ